MDMYVSLDPRRSERPLVELAAMIGHPRSGRRFAAEVVEISREGCRLLTAETLAVGDQLVVSIAGLARWPAWVIWARGGAVGLEFHQALEPHVVAEFAAAFPRQPWMPAPAGIPVEVPSGRVAD